MDKIIWTDPKQYGMVILDLYVEDKAKVCFLIRYQLPFENQQVRLNTNTQENGFRVHKFRYLKAIK